MPSDHTQFMFYCATLVLIYLAYYSSIPHRLRFLVGILAILFASLVGISRVQLSLHTPSQVYVGAVVGVAWAMLWYTISARLLQRYASTLLSSSLGQRLGICSIIYNDKAKEE